ncbi:MAG: hypothetical protein WHS63_01490 [Tenuifilum sp.]|uniref:hypothetical protein n=1 Tax=Tenuifilum sp. TaxID=2760880 RepID=UPI0030AE5AC6
MVNIECYGVQELSTVEKNSTEGGNIWVFFAGAIVGGIVYDAAKAAYIAAVEGYINASANGTYEGMPSPSFRH